MKELLDRVLAQSCASSTIPVEQWEGKLVEFAEVTLDTFLEYPAIAVTATALTMNGPSELTTMELMLSCFAQTGLEGRALAEQYAICGSYLLSSFAGLVRGQLESPESSYAWCDAPLKADTQQHKLVMTNRDGILAVDQRAMFLAGVRQIVAAGKLCPKA